MSVLVVKNVSKKFGSFTALKNINLEVNEGEVFGFIGPNGAGKSTTIRTILGILKASGGDIKVFGKDAWNDSVEIHKDIAYVPGDVNLWPNLTGGEVIDLFMKLNGSTNKARKQELIKKFDFDPSKKCRTYSKGNKQKVALIAAFASDAKLYILDEPTSGLDPLMERVFQECIMEVKYAGKSVLLSSHILSEVERLCDRVAIIKEGEIIETGTLNELKHLRRTILSIKTLKPVVGLDKLEGVYDLEINNTNIGLQVDTNKISEVMRFISDFNIIKLESKEPTLEDLFMYHYEKIEGEH